MTAVVVADHEVREFAVQRGQRRHALQVVQQVGDELAKRHRSKTQPDTDIRVRVSEVFCYLDWVTDFEKVTSLPSEAHLRHFNRYCTGCS